ncbi:hypothetical protein AAF712_007272 [Marasmius tenuissimus]|uniref:Uncharacterized protein n=1 Tax=Marasmius tenuissimus TaxID=585030 RepID=A0ABR2ZYB9_9AGAR
MATLAVVTNRVSAIPFSELARGLPSDITHVAIDEDTSHYLAFKRDGTLHSRYPIEMNTGMNISAIGYPDRAALLCVTDEVIQVKSTAGSLSSPGTDPTGHDCQTRQTTSNSAIVGTTGKVTVSVEQGFSSESSYTVTSMCDPNLGYKGRDSSFA